MRQMVRLIIYSWDWYGRDYYRVGEVLKEKLKDVKIIGIEPSDSPVLSKGIAGSHKIQIGAGFVPKILNINIIDEIITVSDEDAGDTHKNLQKKRVF